MTWKIVKSKTFWFNLISGAIVVVDQLVGSKMIPPEYAASAIAIGNFILRMITTKPLAEK